MKPLVILILLIAFVGCSTFQREAFIHIPDSGAVVPLKSRELDVIETFLRETYRDAVAKGIPLIIDETPSISMILNGNSKEESEASLIKDADDSIPQSAIADFLRKNEQSNKIGEELGSRIKVIFVSDADLKNIFRDNNGWNRFYRHFPSSPGSITISRVGFSSDGTTALLYHGSQQHWLAGSGQIHVFKRKNSQWVEVQAKIGPMWISNNNANGPVQLIPMPSALLSCLLLAQEIMPKASGDT